MTKRDELPEEGKKLRYQEKKRLAEEIYETRIRHLIGPEDEDKYVKIDVTTGDYEIHENSASRWPQAAYPPSKCRDSHDATGIKTRRHPPS